MKKIFNKAKIGLMLKGSVFLSTITFSVKNVFSTSISTAGTDGLQIIYNPDFFKALTEEERIGLIAHETWHIALSHMIRIGNRDFKIWNMAGDYVINNMLIKAGFTIPKQGLVDKKYTNWSTVEVYNDLILHKKQPPKDYILDIIINNTSNDPADTNITQQQQAVETAIKGLLIKATTMSQMQGEKAEAIPSEISRTIDELINPKLSWDEILHRYMDGYTKGDYSYQKPNRRYLPDFYLPGQHSKALKSITFGIDTSGSISQKDYSKILAEAQNIIDTYKPKELTIIDCDSKIHNIHVINEDSDIDISSLKFSGGGGTSFKPVIEYCKEHETNLLLYFTDLDATQITEEPGYPVIWLCYSNHSPAPIGSTIYYDPMD